MLSFFPLDDLAEIWDLIESVSEGFPTHSYLTVSSAQDIQVLQSDLDTFERWERTWDKEFNPSKCQVITVSRSKQNKKKQSGLSTSCAIRNLNAWTLPST